MSKPENPALLYTKTTTGFLCSNITLRDLLAGMAMQGRVAFIGCAPKEVDRIAKRAYEMADAMLSAREGGDG